MTETRREIQDRFKAERAYNAMMMQDIKARVRATEILHRVTLAEFDPSFDVPPPPVDDGWGRG